MSLAFKLTALFELAACLVYCAVQRYYCISILLIQEPVFRFRDRNEDINNMESSYGDIQKEEAKR